MKSTASVIILPLCLLFLTQWAGCSNPIVLQRTARITTTTRESNYPFLLTIDGYQLMRFNVHTLDSRKEKVQVKYEYRLKRDSGSLGPGEFATMNEESLLRGRIIIDDGMALVDVEVGRQNEPGGIITWAKAVENGEYTLTKGTSPAALQPSRP